MASSDRVVPEELLDQFKELTLQTLQEFVVAFEATFEVTHGLGPVAVGIGVGKNPIATRSDGDEFDVVLESAGDKKIQVIKALREIISGLGLKEAKDLVESAPTTLLRDAIPTVAAEAQSKLTAAGGRVLLPASLKRSPSSTKSTSKRGGNQIVATVTGTGSSVGYAPNLPAAAGVLEGYIELLGSRAYAASSLGVDAEQFLPESFVPTHDQIVQIGRTMAVGTVFSKYWNRKLFADWLQTPNGHLNFTQPKNLLDMGETEAVVEAIEADAFGSYA